MTHETPDISGIGELSKPTTRFSFEEFSRQPEYRQVNRELVVRLAGYLPKNVFTHVDVATGTGLVPELIIEQAAQNGYERGAIIGVDPNRVSLQVARRIVPPPNISLEFIEGYGQDLARLTAGRISNGGADSVSIHDAIHEIPGEENKRGILTSMAGILKPGGVLSYNSAFTAKGMGESAMKWGKWKLEAMRKLGGRRDKLVEAIRIYTPGEYREMIEDTGLKVIHEDLRTVALSKDAIRAISRYPAFIEGVFADMVGQSDVSIEDKSKALIEAFDNLNLNSLERNWHEVIAQKVK
ncbi:MAG: hypothetical protein A2857_02390 [Candidatus Levybacteria bacterium RIFCSPHIGHO2_01_FULL_36_15]|nr:MAG: hypothetical protein A2857_02390 [Candidatus Levybacteria bacterium RIFCSPHIGHO2_01_FULL_36_15]OGH39249.1 MAG: hypothetical protein A2905_01740 [Candidatus Levybacteria bacterium RIFCSPLOWO2_01_FULL_36_10]